LLEDAGYTKGADGIYAKGGKKLSLRISTTAGRRQRDSGGPVLELGPVGPEGHLTSLATGGSRGKP
jgi:hypothetical protein